MKVCFIGSARYRQPLDPTSAKKFAVLRDLGECFVIGFSQGLRPKRFIEHARFYLLSNLPVPILRYFEMFAFGPLIALWCIWRHSLQVFVAQSPYEGFAVGVAKKIAGWFGRRLVLIVESHGDFEESLFLYRRILLPGLHRFCMRQAALFALGHADLLRAVSNSTKQQLERWTSGIPILQFPTWTDIETFLEAGANEPERPSQNILYAGALIPLKGVHHLINAFACIVEDFSQARLVIAGHAQNKAYAVELKEAARRLGVDGRVQFVGEVPQAELAAWMCRACVFVLPTYSEGLPRVVFEAMATGHPVVASPVSGIPEIIQDGITGFLVPPGDEASLAETLRWVLAHPDCAHEMGRRARAFAERVFSTEAYVQGYAKLFEEAKQRIQEVEISRKKSAARTEKALR